MIYALRMTRSYCFVVLLLLVFPVAPVAAQSTGLSYQGKLSDNGNPANGLYDFQFSLWDAASDGAIIGEINSILGVTVTNGIFTVTLDFGTAAFPGANRYLEIAVRPANTGSYTTLSPRQPILATPYAFKSQNSASADGLSVACVNCVTSGQIQSVNGSTVTGTIPVASVPAGSNNYIQNTTTQQANSNLNISGNGIVGGNGIIGGTLSVGNAGTSARLFLNRASPIGANSADINFYSAGSPDFSLGTSQGSAAPSDFSIYNYGTGSNALTIQKSSGFVGIGTTAPQWKLHLSDSSANATALHVGNTTSPGPLFFLNYGSTGGGIFWPGLDSANTTAVLTTKPFVLGANGGLFFSGSNGGEHMRITPGGSVGIGGAPPGNQRLFINQTQPDAFATWVRTNAVATGSYGLLVEAGTDAFDSALQVNSQSGTPFMRIRGNGNVGIGTTNPAVMLDVAGAARFAEGIVSGPLAGGAPPLFVNGSVLITGQLAVSTMVTIGTQPVCLNGDLLTRCSSSSLRYKTNVGSYRPGLELVTRLRPITFDWKTDHTQDFGLAAEEVEKVASELVFYRDGQIEGVRYDRIGVVLINAIQEQQQQINKQQQQLERQQTQIKQQQAEIETRQQELRQVKQQKELLRQQQQEMAAIKQLVCASHPQADLCKAKLIRRAKFNR